MTQTANKPEPFIINIGRSLGSGGRAIGHILAKDFGIDRKSVV